MNLDERLQKDLSPVFAIRVKEIYKILKESGE